LTLDVARGIAALCVVVFHWTHFFSGNPDQYPLHKLLSIPYRLGWMGVEFFFVLSGAIFFMKYREMIAARRIGGWQFFVLRFSRLYPLYVVTLICVALLQMAMLGSIGNVVMYDVDAMHFVLNLLFIQNWISQVVTFNAPAWSLSIEVFLYLSFFLLFRFARPGVALFFGIAVVGLSLHLSLYSSFLGRGLWCFYLGGAAVTLCAMLPRRQATAICLLGSIGLVTASLLLQSADALYVVRTLAFVLIVAALAMNDGRLRSLVRPYAFLGDISYSSYLLHFPLQLVFMLGAIAWLGKYSVEPFRSPWMLAVFFGVLIVLSLVSFHLFEAPARRAIRSHFGSRAAPVVPFDSALPIQRVEEVASTLIPDQVVDAPLVEGRRV
jgi:peptidoglycan/LPS O-acetylase OafA/YrhL